MRRSVGVGAIKRKQEADAKFKEKGSDIASENLRLLSEQMETFRLQLETFASKFNRDIRSDPNFRKHFLDMCASIGVDPLASSKGFWSTKLNLGTFYYELAVQMLEICIATAPVTGGIMTVEEIRKRVMRSRGAACKDEITKDDVLKAARTLKVLDPGFTLTKLGDDYLVQTVPKEINEDHAAVLDLAKESGYVSVATVAEKLSWNSYRAQSVLDHFLADGMAWLDAQSGSSEIYYWFPAFFCPPDST